MTGNEGTVTEMEPNDDGMQPLQANLAMPASRQRKIERNSTILRILEEPHTVAEVAEIADLNYYTIRNVINELRKTGMVRVQLETRRGASIYLKTGMAAIPDVFDSISGSYIRVTDVVRASASQQYDTNSLRVAPVLPTVMTRIMELVAYAQSTKDIKHESLVELRNQLQYAHSITSNNLQMMEQVLANGTFWTPSELLKMKASPNWNNNEMLFSKARLDEFETVWASLLQKLDTDRKNQSPASNADPE